MPGQPAIRSGLFGPRAECRDAARTYTPARQLRRGIEASRAIEVGPRRDIVVIGASAGGVEALSEIAAGLPDALDAAVFAVLHMSPGSPSFLAGILARAGRLPVSVATDGSPVRRGTICVAPPDFHLALEAGRVRVLRGAKVNGHRPAVDVLFHSAARAYGARVAGVVLTGTLSDGTLGLRAIKRRGGMAIVQSDAVHQGMPSSAIEHVDVDAIVPLHEIARELTMLTKPDEEAATDANDPEATEVEAGFDISELHEAPGSPTVLRCPECNGALWELEDGQVQSYACHVGHVFSTESLLEEQEDAVERAIWSAVRLLEEQAALNHRLADRLERRGQGEARRRASGARRRSRRSRRRPSVARSSRHRDRASSSGRLGDRVDERAGSRGRDAGDDAGHRPEL